MRLFYLVAAAGCLVFAAFGEPVPAATPQNTVQQPTCAEQWQSISANPQAKQADIKAYSARCMTKVAMKGPHGMTVQQRDRLAACDARWKQMTAAHATGTMSYDEFSAQCLVKKTPM